MEKRINELIDISSELKSIKENLRKLGPSRRKGSNFESKIADAKYLYELFLKTKPDLPKDISNEVILICRTINSCYSDILNYENQYLESININNQGNTNIDKMTDSGERFCLKTATSLLPKLTGNENVTQELIDAIELYETMLCGTDKQLMIRFVLKTRLTPGAKMRLSSSYKTVSELLTDMKTHLLTRQSDTTLQSKLQMAKQGDRTVQQFGEEIENLFVNLTITQASGSDAAYKVLRPINERNAIKRFAEGLRSQRLGTIIASRNLTTLKDAIRVAEDESSTSSEQVMSYSRRGPRYSYNNRGIHRGFNRGYNRGNYNRYYSNNNAQNKSRSVQQNAGTWRAGGRSRGYGGASASNYAGMSQRGQRGSYQRNRTFRGGLNHFNHNDVVNSSQPREVTRDDDEENDLQRLFRP
ncbi:uncharacterized protein LOC126381238 [Pectinophora gossypiella]|uniref:uncharacterized protein LOC126381238 n=1 Tax=Pectinophora gossypiella TaxID=13191 RepID=UPI00214E3435|nr:uncharacterized protein LOC126381238 [Pectinophora gossypiella]